MNSEKRFRCSFNDDIFLPLQKHRISIRTVTGRGQSKDSECTLLVGKGANAAPTRLKASHITTNSVKLSWLPSSSNFYHAVFLNDHELRVCSPGVYKLFLTGMYLANELMHQENLNATLGLVKRLRYTVVLA